MRILLVEDDHGVAAFIRTLLEQAGHEVERAVTGAESLDLLAKNDFGAMVLDLMLPGGMSGFDVATAVRDAGNQIPVLMLTALEKEEDIVRGLDVGADDYLTKPFAEGELLARLRAMERRSQPTSGIVLCFSDIELDQIQGQVHRAGKRLSLTPIEFRLLQALMQKEGEAVDRSELLEKVWRMSFDPGTNVVDVHIANLRKKLEAGGGSRVISVVRGVGYRLEVSS